MRLNFKPSCVRTIALIGLSLLFVASAVTGCNLRPWRKFEEKSFDSKGWRDGDQITRAEMVKGLLGARNPLMNQREEGVRDKLGEPDSKIEGRLGSAKVKAWVYKINFNVAGAMDQFMVLFDDRTGLVVQTLIGSSDDPPLK